MSAWSIEKPKIDPPSDPPADPAPAPSPAFSPFLDMDEVHLVIGVTSVVALFVIIANSVSYVGGRVADRTRGNVSDLVNRGGPVTDQVTAVEGETAILEGDYMNATCSAVQSIASKAYTIIGTYLPELPSLTQLNDEEKDAENQDPEPKAKSEPSEAGVSTAWADPRGEE